MRQEVLNALWGPGRESTDANIPFFRNGQRVHIGVTHRSPDSVTVI